MMQQPQQKSSAGIDVVNLVTEVKKAISEAQNELLSNNVSIESVDLEVSTIMKTTASGEFSLQIIPIKFGGEYAKNEVHRLSFSFVPSKVPVKIMHTTIGKELVEAIKLMNAVALTASDSEPKLDLKNAELGLQFGTETNGEIKVFVGIGHDIKTGHSLKISLAKLA